MTDVGVLLMIIIPVSLAAIACLALAFLYRTGTRKSFEDRKELVPSKPIRRFPFPFLR